MSSELSQSTVSLQLTELDRTRSPPASKTISPAWSRIETALTQVHLYGGFVRLRVLDPSTNPVKLLSMDALPGRYRLTALTDASKTQSELMEWNGGSDSGFVYFGEDMWDASTICTDVNVAREFFRDLFDRGELGEETLAQMQGG